jgi:hypothetical protein
MTYQNLKDTFYCTPQEIKEIANIEKDVPDEKISAMQIHVEKFHVNPILTDDLVLAIKSELFASHTGGTISERFVNLLEYIKYVEAYGVSYELIPFLNFKTTKGGIMTMTPSNAQAADINTLAFLRKNNEELMYGYKKDLEDFLYKNESTYPEFKKKRDFYNENNSIGLMFY